MSNEACSRSLQTYLSYKSVLLWLCDFLTGGVYLLLFVLFGESISILCFCLSVCLSACLFGHLHLCMSDCLYVFYCWLVSLHGSLSFCLSLLVCLSRILGGYDGCWGWVSSVALVPGGWPIVIQVAFAIMCSTIKWAWINNAIIKKTISIFREICIIYILAACGCPYMSL